MNEMKKKIALAAFVKSHAWKRTSETSRAPFKKVLPGNCDQLMHILSTDVKVRLLTEPVQKENRKKSI